MRERVPSKVGNQGTSTPGADRSAGHFTREEKREIFKGMVVGELEAGFLRYSKRQSLLKYAVRLGIPEFEACLLIAEAQYYAGDIEPLGFMGGELVEAGGEPESMSVSMKLGLALVAAIAIDLMLIYWLL